MQPFTVHCNNDHIWNQTELVGFLNKNQYGDILINVIPEAPDLRVVGLYDIMQHFQFASVEIQTFNPFEQHDVYNITINKINIFLDHKTTVDHSIQQWNHKKVFLTMFGRPTASRLAIAAYLLSYHTEHSHIHFNASPNDDNINLFEFDKLAQYDKSLLGPVSNLIQHLPLTIVPTEYNDFVQENISIQGISWVEKIVNNPITKCYRDIFVDCVSESHVLGRTFFPTEKTTRPIWCKKPFIIFGSRDYLLYLRQMGFRTFQEFWDEDYDGFEGRDRLNRILRLIDWIGSQSIQTLEKMYQDMQPILEHNYNLLRDQTYTTTIMEVS